MIRDLLSRLCAGLRTPKWLNLPLLIAMLMPLCTHAAALPDGDPDYEFSVDNVTYKCYFRMKLENSNPTPTDKGSKWYTVYALPENTAITHATVRLDFCSDLGNYIPTDEPGYEIWSNSTETTHFVDGAWDGCSSLKWLELIVNQTDHTNSSPNTTDLAPISGLTSLNIFVTGGNRYSSDTKKPYHIFTNINYSAAWYSDMSIYNETKANWKIISYKPIGAFAKSLLKQDSFDMNMDVCSGTGMTPKVEVKSKHLPDDARYYALTFDNEGRPVAPLIGDFKYNVSVKELVGKQKPYTDSKLVDSDIFKNCFDIKEGVVYEILHPNDAKIAEYGYTNIRVTTNSYSPKDIEQDSDGTYILPSDGYYFYFTYDGMEMRYSHIVYSSDLADHMVELEATEWLPHRVTVVATELECDMSNLDDGAVLGIGEYIDGENLNFTPFDEQKKAVLYDYENCFDISLNFPRENTNGEITLQFRNPVYLVMRVKGRNILVSSQSLSQPENTYVNCHVSRDKQKIHFDLASLYSRLGYKGVLSEDDKAGVIFDDKKYYCAHSSGDRHELDLEDLLPNKSFYMKLFYEIDGQEYVSYWWMGISTKTISGKYEMNASTQSVAFNFSDVSYDESYGDVVFEDLAVYLNGKTLYDDAEFEITTQKDIRISNLQIWENYELRGYCRYIRKSDGEKTTLFPIKILFKTEEPTWIAGDAQAMTTTKARLTYTTNLENVSETYVEWRRVDAPDVVKSTVAACPVVDGQLVGVLNNLNPDVYYKFRPVFELNGTPIYGEWIGIFTGDANVWFDPEISTRPARVRKDGTVTLQGSVIPGSGDISEQGFEVWPDGGAQHAPGSGEESSHTFITCNGISISTELTDLKHGVTYTYRAYAKVDGQMYTGPEETFMIPGESGIEDTVGDAEAPTIIGYYNLQGLRSDRPFRGMNIVVYSNGKTEKRIIRE